MKEKTPKLRLVHTDQIYPYKEHITFDNPFDTHERTTRKHWLRSAFEQAGIDDVLVMEKTYRTELAFRSYCDYAHFSIADDLPAPFFESREQLSANPVCIDFVSILPKMRAGQVILNPASSVMRAFQNVSKRTNTADKIHFKAEHEDKVVIVNSQNAFDYLRFWRAIPRPLKNTLYLTDTPEPA